MLTLLGHLDSQRYTPRSFVVAATDRMGPSKAAAFERSMASSGPDLDKRVQVFPAHLCHVHGMNADSGSFNRSWGRLHTLILFASIIGALPHESRA